jgi:hypothetical protein
MALGILCLQAIIGRVKRSQGDGTGTVKTYLIYDKLVCTGVWNLRAVL